MQPSLSWVSSIPGTVAAGLSPPWHSGGRGGCRLGARHPLQELQPLSREHRAGACAPIRAGAAGAERERSPVTSLGLLFPGHRESLSIRVPLLPGQDFPCDPPLVSGWRPF